LWGLPAPPRASRLGLLRRDNVDKRKRKKRLIRLQVHPHRNSLTGIITPVSLYLQVSAGVGSSDLFATQQDDLCYHLHVVYHGRYIYPCGSVLVSLYLWREGLYSNAKRRDMDKNSSTCASAFNVLWI